MLEDIFVPVIGFALGILALKLPYRYNPFRLKYRVGDDTRWGRTIPKIFGWFLVVSCGLWLLGVAALYSLTMFADKS